jgi:hypothetical protein
MAALRSSRQMSSKTNIRVININSSSERPRAIFAARCAQHQKKINE